MVIDHFPEKKPSIIGCFETWMTEYSAKSAYSLESNAPMGFEPEQTRKECVAIYVHESNVL